MIKPVAIILAGGFGKKMGKLSEDIPKSLIDSGGIPLIQRVIAYSELETRCQKIIVSAGHLGNVLEDYFSDRKVRVGCPISVDIEETPLGTGGALLRLFQKYGLSDALVLNGDLILKVRNYSLDSFYRTCYRMIPSSLGLFSVAEARNTHFRYQVSYRENFAIESFQKNYDSNVPGEINTGMYFIKRGIFEYRPSDSPSFSLERELIPSVLTSGAVIQAFPLTPHAFVDMTTESDYRYVQENAHEISRKDW